MISSNFKFLTEKISADIVGYIMKEKSIPMQDALKLLYNSETFEKLLDEETGLYINSSAYVYELLKRELKTGKF